MTFIINPDLSNPYCVKRVKVSCLKRHQFPYYSWNPTEMAKRTTDACWRLIGTKTHLAWACQDHFGKLRQWDSWWIMWDSWCSMFDFQWSIATISYSPQGEMSNGSHAQLQRMSLTRHSNSSRQGHLLKVQPSVSYMLQWKINPKIKGAKGIRGDEPRLANTCFIKPAWKSGLRFQTIVVNVAGNSGTHDPQRSAKSILKNLCPKFSGSKVLTNVSQLALESPSSRARKISGRWCILCILCIYKNKCYVFNSETLADIQYTVYPCEFQFPTIRQGRNYVLEGIILPGAMVGFKGTSTSFCSKMSGKMSSDACVPFAEIVGQVGHSHHIPPGLGINFSLARDAAHLQSALQAPAVILSCCHVKFPIATISCRKAGWNLSSRAKP